MRFSTLFAAVSVVATGVSAQNLYSGDSITDALSLTAENYYGSPIPPWKPNHKPGWYYGKNPPEGIIYLLEEIFCDLLELFPFCLQCPKPHHPPPPNNPPPPPEYTPTYNNLTCASQDGSFQTFGLVDTVQDCQDMCDTVPGCIFVNAYHDNNDAGKGNSTELTCSLFSKCLDASSADNCAGQGQPDGSVDFITDSSGWCKSKPTA